MNKLLKKSVAHLSFFFISYVAKAEHNDTTIISRSTVQNGTINSIVYIATDKKAWQYDSIQSFLPASSTKVVNVFPFGNWVELNQYKGNYYLYYPCDLGDLYRLGIHKNIVREYGVETEEFILKSITLKKSNTYIVDISSAQGINKKIILYLIDKDKGIIVKENVGADNESKYQLLVAADKIKKFPLIVNYCEAKNDELSFQKINYKSLLHKLGYN